MANNPGLGDPHSGLASSRCSTALLLMLEKSACSSSVATAPIDFYWGDKNLQKSPLILYKKNRKNRK